MESPRSKHKARKKSKPKTSGVYYKFSWNDEDMSASGDEGDGTLSPREYVDKILQETELVDGPITDHSDKLPDLDLSFDFLPEMTPFDGYGARPETLNLDEMYSPQDGAVFDSDSQYEAETPEVLESPLDHPDSGYIDFLTTPSSSGSIDHGKRHSDGLGSDFHTDNESVCSDDITNRNTGDKSKTKNRDTFPNAIRFTKFNFEKLEEDNYIDDDIHRSYQFVPPSGGNILDKTYQVAERDVTDMEADLLRVSGADSIHDITDLDPETHLQEAEVDDTNPIILVEGAAAKKLQWRRRKARIKVAIIVLGVVFGLGALAAIAYLIFRFLVHV